jgi:short-subunit dehydrogenase
VHATKPLAVVTGASSGIGLELARQFAAHDYDLLVAAEDAGLSEAADRLRQEGADVQVVQTDLATFEGVEVLAKRVLPGMVERGEGRVLFTSSIAGEMPAAFSAVYGASKAFVLSFSDALREELKDTGVSITALMPGPTETRFFERAGMLDTNVGQSEKADAEQVAKQGFDALMDGDAHVIAGPLKTKVQGMANEVLPEALKAKAHRRMAEPRSSS